MVSGILLSAGLSSRFGSPKALACINNMPAITYLLEKLTATSLGEIVIVLGADSQPIELCLFKHKMIRVVYNKDYKLGQTSTVQTGLKEIASEATGFMLLPVDCPFVKAATVETIIEHFTVKHLKKILVPEFDGHRGHPPIFDIRFKDPVLNLDPAQGINNFMHEHSQSIKTIKLDDPGITQSFNTPEEFAEIKKTILTA
jgi:molybdenum cofactor cytidylyltransferase